MPISMSQLSAEAQALPVFILTVQGRPVVLDRERANRDTDIMLLWTSHERAARYAAHDPSLQSARPAATTIAKLVDHFQGRVALCRLDSTSTP